jgi:hypothetical protein
MNQRELVLSWGTVTFEVLLCLLVYARYLRHRLPFFTLYVTTFSMCSIAVGLIYHFFGFGSVTSYYAYWTNQGVNVIVRSLVVAELCWYRLREYRGIWAFSWRVLILLTLFFLGHAALDAWGQPNRFFIYSLTFERDINIASVIILILLLFIRRYYGFSLEPLHRLIAVGLLFYCVIDFVDSTVLRDLLTGSLFSWFSIDHMSLWPTLRPQVERVHDLWGTVRVSAFMISMSIWCYALRKPLPAPAQAPELLPAEVYGKLSPAVNMRLRAFNDRLLEMLKP